MELSFASYNIHKGVGTDRRRDPERIMAVLRALDADVIALQEADERFGERASVLPRALLDDSPWRVVPVARRARSIGWHGNALLVRRSMDILHAEALELPTLEPRGAACGEIVHQGVPFRVIGTHLDLSGLRRRDQVRSLLAYLAGASRLPTVIMGDFNQWGHASGAMREFGMGWQMIAAGASFPSRRPIARLDRIVATDHWRCHEAGAHRTALTALASDHLPIGARLELPNL